MSAFSARYKADVVPLVAAMGFTGKWNDLTRAIPIGTLSVFVAKNGQHVDIGLGLQDALGVTGSYVNNLAYERILVPPDEAALAKAIARLQKLMRTRWKKSIDSAAAKTPPNVATPEAALQVVLDTAAKQLARRLPKGLAFRLRDATLELEVPGKPVKRLPISAIRGALRAVFADYDDARRARNILSALSGPVTAFVDAISATQPAEAALLMMQVAAPLYDPPEFPKGHPLAKVFAKASALAAKFGGRDPSTPKTVTELLAVYRSTKSDLMRHEVLAHIESAFPYVKLHDRYQQVRPALEQLANDLCSHADDAFADAGADLRAHLQS